MAPGSTQPPPDFTDSVRLGDFRTEIHMGPGCRGWLPQRMRSLWPDAERYGLVVDAGVEAKWARGGIPAAPRKVTPGPIVVIPAGEAAKDRRVLAEVQDRLVELKREEPVVVVGGGAALDVGGFAAATVRRGLPWIAVPTSVVGMADAALGGKVAVNHPRGKNLLGTFHNPDLVFADTEYLRTLPDRERVAGLAEVYKAGRVGDTTLLTILRKGPPADETTWTQAIRKAVAVKARLVERDERDWGARRLLNYGHTVGHALETILGNERIRHGEAVAIGMQVAARIASARKWCGADFTTKQGNDLRRLGLPVDVPEGIAPDRLLEVLGMDKKRAPGGMHTFVLPLGADGVRLVDDVTEEEIRRAL